MAENKEIIKVREWLSALTSTEFKSLCNGNEFSVGVGGLELNFKIN